MLQEKPTVSKARKSGGNYLPREKRIGRDGNIQTKAEQRAERTLRGLPPDYAGRAAQSTVDAVVFELRDGAAQLSNARTQDRLSECSPTQIKEVIERLGKLASLYPAITDQLLESLRGLLS
jgi:hypothetical protein